MDPMEEQIRASRKSKQDREEQHMATFRTPAPTPDDPHLETEEDITTAGAPCVNLFYIAPTEAAVPAGNTNPDSPKDRVLIATVTEDMLRTYPIHVRRQSPDYLQSKYGTVTTITFAHEHFGFSLPKDRDDFIGILEGLPAGCAKQFQYGLGLAWEYRFLVEAIAHIEGVTEIILTGGHETRLEPPVYMLGVKRYHELRRGLRTIGTRSQREAHDDKRLLAYLNLQTAVDRERFPVRTKKVRPDAIYELVKVGGQRSVYTRDDRKAAINLVKSEKEKIASTDPADLLALKADIEKVTLAALIEKFEGMLSKDLSEARWQEFLKSNPFILSLAFAHPVFVVQDQAYVGGASLHGVGEKIADFLMAQRYTGNIALIEIKRPTTALLGSDSFRTDLFGPAKHLTEAISQVLDQRFKLQTSFTQKAYASGLSGVHPYAIRCIVIAGTIPAEQVRKKSLDLFRNATKDVTVVTFDELVEQLKEIQRIFTASDQGQEV
jgi:Domain of unknown function (DUF4263)